MKDRVNTYVNLSTSIVELSVATKKDLSPLCGNAKNTGHITCRNIYIDSEAVFWDGMDFFINCSKKEFKKECKKELQGIGLDWKQVYKDIKKLIKIALKLKILSK